tara:strand:+ start:259 stop:831 length:573 start_codon:yes stop_codon:yes gene_type:complete
MVVSVFFKPMDKKESQHDVLVSWAELAQYSASLRTNTQRHIQKNKKISFDQLNYLSPISKLENDQIRIMGEGIGYSSYSHPYKINIYKEARGQYTVTLGNRLRDTKTQKPELLFIAFPIMDTFCKEMNPHLIRDMAKGAEIPQFDIVPNLTPNIEELEMDEIVTIPFSGRAVCFKGGDGVNYYLHSLAEQ